MRVYPTGRVFCEARIHQPRIYCKLLVSQDFHEKMHIPPFFLVFVMHLRELTRGTQLNKGKTVRWEILQSKHGQILQNAGKYFKVNTDSKETAQNSIPSHLLQKNMKVGRMRWATEKLTYSQKMPKFAVLRDRYRLSHFFLFLFFYFVRDSSPNLSFPAAASADVEALWPFRYHFFFVKVFTVSYTFDHILWVFRVAGKVVEVFLFCTAVSCSFIAPAHFHRQHKTINTNEIFLPLSMTHQKQSTIT